MKITINVNNKPVEIELTADQIKEVKKRTDKVTDRIKTFEDVLAELNINEDEFANLVINDGFDDEAFKKLKLVARALNERWVPNWSDTNEKKWYPCFDMNAKPSGFGFSCTYYVDWSANTTVGSRLVFKSSELAEYAANQFLDLYKEYLA